MKIHLVFGLITVLLLVIVIGSRTQESFSFESQVVRNVEQMAREGLLTANLALPKKWRDLTPEEYKEIEWKDELTLWRKAGLPFQVQFVHPGPKFEQQVQMFEISKDDTMHPVRYSSAAFEFGPELTARRLPNLLGYAGFRLLYPINRAESLDSFVEVIGDSSLRAIGKGQVFGVAAKGVVIDPGGEQGYEQLPVFTRFWLKKPEAFANTFMLYAHLESGDVRGAYQFEIQPGEETRVKVRARLYFSEKLKEVGYAPLISMFWFGENTSNTFGDFRPEVHKSDGLLLQRNNGEWIWHPLAWAREDQLNVFDNAGPKGFGLMQRDRDFSHYQDLKAVYHKMASVWVQPIKGFDAGKVVLRQDRTKDEEKDNVLAYWVPAKKPEPLQPVDLEYELRWFTENGDLPPVGRCLSTRVDLQNEEDRRQFFLEFAGGPLDRLKPNEMPACEIASPTQAAISEISVTKNEFNNSWRVSFVVTANQKAKPTEILCRLMNNNQALTETWTYTWIP